MTTTEELIGLVMSRIIDTVHKHYPNVDDLEKRARIYQLVAKRLMEIYTATRGGK